MCRIIPPEGWAPPFTIDPATFKFPTRCGFELSGVLGGLGLGLMDGVGLDGGRRWEGIDGAAAARRPRPGSWLPSHHDHIHTPTTTPHITH